MFLSKKIRLFMMALIVGLSTTVFSSYSFADDKQHALISQITHSSEQGIVSKFPNAVGVVTPAQAGSKCYTVSSYSKTCKCVTSQGRKVNAKIRCERQRTNKGKSCGSKCQSCAWACSKVR